LLLPTPEFSLTPTLQKLIFVGWALPTNNSQLQQLAVGNAHPTSIVQQSTLGENQRPHYNFQLSLYLCGKMKIFSNTHATTGLNQISILVTQSSVLVAQSSLFSPRCSVLAIQSSPLSPQTCRSLVQGRRRVLSPCCSVLVTQTYAPDDDSCKNQVIQFEFQCQT